MAFQGYSVKRSVVDQLVEFKGSIFLGTKVHAPLSKYEHVYVLPMENVLATKGTGVVTSVPPDSPDDYITLQDLKKKAAYYNIDPLWVADFEPIPIINTPTYGELAAPKVCKLKKINSQKDRAALTDAKELVYKEGFYDGTMLIGEYAGKTVREAKALIKDGSKTGLLGMEASEMMDEVWDYISCDTQYSTSTTILKEKLDTMRREFRYFYPPDLRVSGKDLIPNHLTFFIYNHVYIFPEKHWPREGYGADASRISLADAGDSVEDANFEEATANAAILRLFTLKEWCEEQIKNKDNLHTGPTDSFHDRVFKNEINKLIQQNRNAYEDSLYRDALKYGFYELQTSHYWYREATSQEGEGMHRDLILRWIELQALLLSPIAPHWSEYIWSEVLQKDGFIVNASFPSPSEPVDESLIEAIEYIRKLIKNIRDLEGASQKKKKKGSKADNFDPNKPKSLKLFVATKFPEWQDFGG
nr:1069_t:CDS:2 [Entrophospora candida]